MSGRILFPYDGSSLAEQALPCAIHLARAAGMKLVMVQAVQEAEALLAAENAIQALAHRVRREGIPVVTRVRLGPVHTMLEEELITWEPDWVVLSTHGQSGTGRWLYGRVAQHVLRSARVPVILVHAFGLQTLASDSARVLVPLDGSPAAEQALPAARRLSQVLGGTLVLLRVVEPPLPSQFRYDQSAPYVEFDPHVELEQARAYLHRIAGTLDPAALGAGPAGPPDWTRAAGGLEIHAVIGTPGSAIAAAVHDQHATAVVLTVRGAGGAQGVLGGAATIALQLAHVPLVMVPVPVAVPPAMPDAAPPAATVRVAEPGDVEAPPLVPERVEAVADVQRPHAADELEAAEPPPTAAHA